MAIRTDYTAGEPILATDANEVNTQVLANMNGVAENKTSINTSIQETVTANFHNLWNKYYSHEGIHAYTSGTTLRLYDPVTPSWEARNLTLDWASATAIGGVAIYSDFTYILLTSATEERMYQFTTGDLATAGTLMTGLSALSGTRVQNSFGENLYVSSSMVYDSVSFLVSGEDTTPLGIAFSSDGTKMFMLGNDNSRVYQYTLATAWNVGTASYDSVSFLVSGQETNPRSIGFSSDGTKMFIMGFTNKRVYQYTLATAWNVGTASYDSVSFLVSQDTDPYGIAFSSDGTKMFTMGNGNDRAYQYSTPAVFSLGVRISEYSIAGTALTLADTHTTNGLFVGVDSLGLYYKDGVIKKKLFVDDSIKNGLVLTDAINLYGKTYLEDSNTLYLSPL